MKLAIVSSYDEACGTATCAKAIAQSFQDKFEITVFNVKTAALIAHELLHNSQAAEDHIDRICTQLGAFDCVNLHLEWGIFGRDPDIMRRRIVKLVRASKRLILTLYSLHISEHLKLVYQGVFQALKERDNSLPYWFIAHLPREADMLHLVFGFENVSDFPIVYLTEKEVADFRARASVSNWKEQHGFKKDDIVILRAGFLTAHKDPIVSLKALRLLPSNYKLAFSGGEHPPGIQKFAIAPSVQDITNFLDQYDDIPLRERSHTAHSAATTLGDRVRFFGNQFDDDLYLAMCCADFVTLTHLESGQSSSGIASIALQLECKVILSYNTFFMEYEKYYKGSFSFFTIGNPYELRDKILTFDPAQAERLKEYGKKYSLNNLAELYKKIYADMTGGRVNNAGRKSGMLSGVVAPLPPSPQPSTSPQPQHNDLAARQQEVNRIIYALLWKLVLVTKQFRSFLRRQRDSINDMKRTILKPFS